MFATLFVNVCAAVVGLVSIAFVITQIRKVKHDVQRYKFFALRDKLYRYSIEGKIDREHKVFVFTDRLISKSISAAKTYDIFLLVDVLKDMDDVNYKKRRESFYDEIKDNEHLLEIYNEFASITMSVIKENSFVVKSICFGLKIRVLARVLKPEYKVKLRQVKPYSVYQQFQHFQERFA